MGVELGEVKAQDINVGGTDVWGQFKLWTLMGFPRDRLPEGMSRTYVSILLLLDVPVVSDLLTLSMFH